MILGRRSYISLLIEVNISIIHSLSNKYLMLSINCIHFFLLELTKSLTIYKATNPWSIGTKCPALFTILKSNFPAFFWDPATFPSTFQTLKRASLN